MPNYILRAEEASRSQSNAPGSMDIQSALDSMAGVQWTGPTRITRTGCVSYFVSACNLTDVARVFNADSDASAQQIAQSASSALATIDGSDWGAGASAQPFNPAVNGTLEWWSSGQAAQTQSINDFPAVWTPVENPVGPTIAGVTAPRGGIQQAGENVGQGSQNAGLATATDFLTKLLITAGVVVAGGTVLYLSWPLLSRARAASSARSRAKAQYARANPSRRRRRSARRSAR